jgi:hypothetical protein
LVEVTLLTRTEITPEVERYLGTLRTDNLGNSERKLAPLIRKKVLPIYRKELRTVTLPPGLDHREEVDLEKVEWPKGLYMYKMLIQATEPYKNILDGSELVLSYLDTWSHPWQKSLTHDYDDTLLRNRRSLSHGAGMPSMGTKRDQINAAILYNESLKGPEDLDKCWSILAGFRAQKRTEPGTDPVMRLVWGTPVHYWHMECEAFDSAISQTIANVQGRKDDIFVFYVDASIALEWIHDKWPSVVQWVNLDAEQFDSSVTAPELRQVVEYFAPDYYRKDLIAEYLIHANLIMPDEIISRSGGMPSGTKITNLGDGFVNVLDFIEAFARYKLDRYIECVLVNGDDISFGLSTKLTRQNLDKLNSASRRMLNVDKVELGPFVWNSSLYSNGDIICATVGKTLNNAMFTERQKSAIHGSREMIELKLAQQTKRIETNPIGVPVIKALASISKYSINTMSDEDLMPAAQALEDADYMERDAKSIINDARKSLYAEYSA